MSSKSSLPTWLDTKEYPFASHYFQLPIGRLHYADEGEGEPIVMIPGNPAWSFAYRKIIKAMKVTNRCIAVDHIGFGLSDKPVDWDYLPEHQAENFENLMDSLNLTNITMIVNDWGGPIGLSYAIKHPDKIKRLIILNTWLWPVNNEKHFLQFSSIMGSAFGRFMIKQFNFFGKSVVKMAMGKNPAFTPAIHKHYYRHMATPMQRKGSWVFPKEIIGSTAWLKTLWEQKDKINNLPTTFIWGLQDIAFRLKELHYWTANWHNYKVIKLEDAGHYPQEVRADVIINELKQLAPLPFV